MSTPSASSSSAAQAPARDSLFVLGSGELLARELMSQLRAAADAAIAARGSFHVALSGGSLLGVLADALLQPATQAGRQARINTSAWHFWFTDERLVSGESSESNSGEARRLILQFMDATDERIHAPSAELVSQPAQAAAAYEAELRRVVPGGVLDLVLLGMGPDGHCASLFPGHALLNHMPTDPSAQGSLVASLTDSPKPPAARITLTFAALRQARASIFVVAGEGKAEMVARVWGEREARTRTGGSTDTLLPSSRVSTPRVTFLLDKAAASKLDPMVVMFADPEFVPKYAAGPTAFCPGFLSIPPMAMTLLREGVAKDAAAPRVLVLGAGGGLELKSFTATQPTWRFVGVDPSAPMLAQARSFIGAEGMKHVELVEGYIPASPAGPFEGATCLLTMHFLPDDATAQGKLAALRAIRSRLKPGAAYVQVNFAVDRTSPSSDRLFDRIASFATIMGMSEADASKKREQFKTNLSLGSPERDEALLREAGFARVERVFQGLSWYGWVAYAPTAVDANSASSPTQSAVNSRQQAEADDAVQAQLASLPLATQSEQAYASIAAELMQSAEYWRAQAAVERRKAESALQSAQHAIHKLTQAVQSEGESLLNSLRTGALITSSGSTTSASPSSLHSSSSHSHHPSHLSRRVSFNRDVLMVVSPEIGHEGAVASVEEEESKSVKFGSSASSGSGSGAAQGVDADGRPTGPGQRRLSRSTEINEGAILKQHLGLDQLEQENISKQ